MRKKNQLEKKKKTEEKDGEYLITYTRHLEKRLRKLETEKQLLDAERLRLEQELHSLSNEINRNRNSRFRNLPTFLNIGNFFAAVTAKDKELFFEILEKLMLFILKIRNLDDQSLKDVNPKVSNLFEEIEGIERTFQGKIKKLQEPTQKQLKWYEFHSIKPKELQGRKNRKEIEEKKGIDYKFKILVLGESRKTAFIHQFTTGSFMEDLKMTIGVDFSLKNMKINGKKIKLEIWDFGGEERFRFILPDHIKNTNGAIILYDDVGANLLKKITEDIELIWTNAGDIPIFLNVPELPFKAEEIVALTGRYRFTEITSEIGPGGEHTFELLTKKILERFE